MATPVRYIEDVMAAHEAATERRKAGKPIWDRRIDIRSIIHEDQDNSTPKHVMHVAERITALLRSKTPGSWFDITHDDYDRELDEIVEILESMSVKDDDILADFNYQLNELYNWADVKRIWLS